MADNSPIRRPSHVGAGRRKALAATAALATSIVVRPARSASDALADAIAAFTGGVAPGVGGLTLEVARLVDNGNVVPVSVDFEPSAVRVDEIAIFNERNPERDVVRFRFGPASARASASTRIRLATSQRIVAVARLADGSFRSAAVDVIVTLAACIEGE